MDILTTGASAGLPARPARAGPTTRRRRGLAAPLALPAGFVSLLIVGALAAGTSGKVGPTWVLILAAVIVGAGSAVAETAVAPVLGAIGWLTVTGFSARPYAQLQMTGPVALRAAIVMACCSLGGAVAGELVRRLASSFTLWIVEVPEDRWPAAVPPDLPIQGARSAPAAAGQADSVRRLSAADQPALAPGAGKPNRWARRLAPVASLPRGIGSRRLVAGVILVAGLPLLTAALVAAQHWLSLADDLLIYLVAVVAVAVVGGFWPAVLAAVSSSLLLNWYFTRPVHTLTIADPQNLLALLLFVTVAVIVSSVVHLAAHRAAQAARSSEEAAELLALAQTVLGGADTPAAVLDHLTATEGGHAELLELVAGQWVRAATSGTAPAGSATVRVQPRPGLVLLVSAQSRPVTARLLDGFAAQAAAALDRDRLRTQAAQAEALAEGNRMRTALLAAVSHDLRTPLASIKASVSTLRQTDVEWTAADQAALLATIEQGADRLDALIGNLLDMSRLSTGSLQPFLRPTAIDEVAPVALLGLDVGGRDVAGAESSSTGAVLRLAVPDGLPLIRTDPGLLERVLANLFANALAYSPPGHPPSLCAREDDRSVVLDIIDHGPGVPDAFKSRMFEPFERLDERAGGTGVGLGLAVVKGFLDAMGGSVAAQDTPGGGLTIRVTLPASDATGVGAQARTLADP
jgi:signal transduction histidine kinase